MPTSQLGFSASRVRLGVPRYLVCAVIFVGAFFHPGFQDSARSWQRQDDVQAPILPPLKSVVTVPMLREGAPAAPTVSAAAVYIVDEDSSAILLARGERQLLYPASLAKLMTALVAYDAYEPATELLVPPDLTVEGTVAGLQPGETLVAQDLFTALLVSSGNDAAEVFARNYPGGEAAFVAMMNAKAKQLHIRYSAFRTPSGLDEEGQVVTAQDLAILTREVVKVPLFRRLVRTPSIEITDVTGKITHVLHNTNALLEKVPGVVGVKTGTTELARENLITQIERDGHTVTVVVLGSHDRYADTVALIDWVFANFRWQEVSAPAYDMTSATAVEQTSVLPTRYGK